ncbi:MAG: 50S ribosomal protein L31 [Planctomycetes bacterium]|nr:50S ribosomal protein L31 [Planctomycetota bacterium]
MKKQLHPEISETKVTCGCGNSFTLNSVKKELKVSICWKCHPFYTGQHKLIDTAGRLEKFRKKYKNYMEKLSPASKKS